jgi:hypothetical protein
MFIWSWLDFIEALAQLGIVGIITWVICELSWPGKN